MNETMKQDLQDFEMLLISFYFKNNVEPRRFWVDNFIHFIRTENNNKLIKYENLLNKNFIAVFGHFFNENLYNYFLYTLAYWRVLDLNPDDKLDGIKERIVDWAMRDEDEQDGIASRIPLLIPFIVDKPINKLKLYKTIVEKQPEYIRHIKDKQYLENIGFELIKNQREYSYHRYDDAVKHIAKITDNKQIKLDIIKVFGADYISYFNEIDEDIKQMAIQRTRKNDFDFRDFCAVFDFVDDDFKAKAVKHNFMNLDKIKNPSEDFIMKLFSELNVNKSSLKNIMPLFERYGDKLSIENQLLFIQAKGLIIKYIPTEKQTEKFQLEALKQNLSAIHYIEKPTPKVKRIMNKLVKDYIDSL